MQPMKMIRILAVFLLGSFIHSASGSAYLVAKLSTAKCESGGHLEGLTVTSVTCDYSDKCHYGDRVFITGQGTRSGCTYPES